MADAVHEVRALVRDEGRLRQAVQRDQALRYDRDTAVELRERLDDLLESITALARDDQLWHVMAETADEPLTDEQFSTFADLAAGDLARLLEVFGYHCPPPPPVDELVDDTLDALGAARAVEGDRAALVWAARWHLITFGMRVRRQIELAPPAAAPSTVRRVARHAGSVARQLLPLALSVAVGVTTGGALAGAVPVAVKTAEKLAEHGTKLASEGFIGWLSRRRAASGEAEAETPPVDADPLHVHVAALFTVLGAIRADVGLLGHVVEHGQVGVSVLETHERHLARFRRHGKRIGELLQDRQWQNLRLRGALHRLDEAVDEAFEAANSLYRNPHRVAEAAEELERVARELHDALDAVVAN
ncbi:hypothetical protein M8542_19565 [Amycolatopsis sp. OK19-0408]|uniref:Uncharacterized protein n=1 Tax=Amycolatopsis iheyensis TaxID=2945988 RepID=A0A9X2NE47_9PSEU|nr:hypothetical protein [Amycolatopsis iheyensis]MCR6485029.1 hypothetical protein [Amycolatopsis iheyensis]